MSDLQTCTCSVKVKLSSAGSRNKSVVILFSTSFLNGVSFYNSSSINQMIIQIQNIAESMLDLSFSHINNVACAFKMTA